MDMRVEQEVLPPGVQDADHPDLGAEVSRVGCHLDRGGGASAKQKLVEQARIGQRQDDQLMGNTEHDVKVTGWQQFLLACDQPALACLSLTLRAVPVSA